MSELSVQYQLKFLVEKQSGYKNIFTAQSVIQPLLAEILSFSSEVDEVDDIIEEIDKAKINNSYEDISVLLHHIRILPDQIRIYQKGNNDYESPNITMDPDDFKRILTEWKMFLQKHS